MVCSVSFDFMLHFFHKLVEVELARHLCKRDQRGSFCMCKVYLLSKIFSVSFKDVLLPLGSF